MNATPTELLLSKIPDAKPNGKGWSARCPAHDDRRASLSVSEGDDGRALVWCHAGCTVEAICNAAGLRVADLMPEDPSTVSTSTKPRQTREKRQYRRQQNGKPATTYRTAKAAIRALERKHGKRSASWTYHDANGDPVGVVVRWNNGDGKDIRPVSRLSDGWIIGGMPDPRPLYCLPDLAGADRIFICEGEKAADAARSIGLTATTSAHGSRSADKTDWSPLAGKECEILPDHDEPGKKYADTVRGILAGLTPPATVKVVQLPDLPDHGDMVDWVEAGGTKEELGRLAEAVPLWTLAAALEPGPILTCFADVEPRAVSWLWPERIPLGRITLLVGRPGEGKSFLTTDAAARVTTGTPWPDGSDCPQGSVILISAEDDPADTIRPRLDAHYADVRRVHLLSAVRRVDGDGHYERLITLADVDAIEAALMKLPDCKLIVVDPIGSFLGTGTDAHRDNEVRGVLAPIAKLAEKYGPAVLVVAHRRKSGGNIADDLALGSRAFTGIARAVWHVTRDNDSKARRLLLPGKNNLAREGNGLAFSIIGEPARISWERDSVAMSADDALAIEYQNRGSKPGPEADALKEAMDWLRLELAGGPRPGKDLMDEWIQGRGGSKRTLHRAKKALEVDAFRVEVPGPWWWKLPDKDAGIPNHRELGDLGNLAENAGVLTDSVVVDSKDAKFREPSDAVPASAPNRVQVTV